MWYRKKPVSIEAVQYLGAENLEEVLAFASSKERPASWSAQDGLKIKTLEGTHIALINDYIIKGIHGECYPCKPDIFIKTYTNTDGTNIMEEK